MINVLYCSSFNLNNPSAGLKRILQLRDSLKNKNINVIISGSGCKNVQWRYYQLNNDEYIQFNKETFSSIRHSNSLKIISEAKKFYKQNINHIIQKYEISGIIIYSPMGEVVGTIIKKLKNTKTFIIADCGEYYKLSFKYLLNGILFQQAFFKHFQMKKLDGVIVPSPEWENKAKSLNLPSVFIPGIPVHSKKFRNTPSNKTSDLNIVFMGRLNDRELPKNIFETLSLCIKKDLKFTFHLLGTKGDGFRENYWLSKLKKNKKLIKYTKIYGYVDEKIKENILINADLFLILRPANSETRHLFPSRVPEFLSTGNPTIITNTPSLNLLFKEGHGVKFIKETNSPDDIANSIINLANNPILRFEVGEKGRLYAQNNFTHEILGERLGFFLKNLNNNLK